MSDRKKGKVVCKRVVAYDEIVKHIKNNTVGSAVKIVLQEEQNKWLKENDDVISGNHNWKIQFIKECFPKWTYYIDNIQCGIDEVSKANSEGIVWDFELETEYDAKLEAYKMFKNEKE